MAGTIVLASFAIGIPAWLLLSSSASESHGRSSATATVGGCPTPAAVARARTALAVAKLRYGLEAGGAVIHGDLRRIAHDRVLLRALAAGDLKAALAEADRQLVHHVVRIRVVRGARVLVDANPTSFAVAGSGMELYGPRSTRLGRLEITIQDVIGFAKLEYRHDATWVLARGARGQVRTLLAAAQRLSLPRYGCSRVGAQSYVVRSFRERTFSGEPLTIWLLTAA
jgi:hypothetical protein